MDFSDSAIIGDPAEFLLERARVAVSSGPTFGAGGEGFVRLNFGTTPAILAEILERMSRALPNRGIDA
jgi:cystathionine beta-lyase